MRLVIFSRPHILLCLSWIFHLRVPPSSLPVGWNGRSRSEYWLFVLEVCIAFLCNGARVTPVHEKFPAVSQGISMTLCSVSKFVSMNPSVSPNLKPVFTFCLLITRSTWCPFASILIREYSFYSVILHPSSPDWTCQRQLDCLCASSESRGSTATG